MTSHAYQIRSRTQMKSQGQPKLASSDYGNENPSVNSPSCSKIGWDNSDKGSKLNGNLSEEKARQQLILKYSEDKIKFQQKEKEKAKKKQNEKFERYQHILLGEKLQQQTEDRSSIGTIRQQQQQHYDALMSKKASDSQKEKESLQTNQNERNGKLKSNDDSRHISENNLSSEFSSFSTRSSRITNEQKEKEFRNQMRAHRERMQNLYNSKLKNN